MTDTSTYNKVATIAASLLLVSVCSAEYDLYCIGSSYIIDHQYIKSMADSAGVPLKAGRSEIYGNMNSIRQRAAGRPLDGGNPLSELATGTVDVLAMTATRPWRYTEAEAGACSHFSKLLLQHNPDARIFIHDYWTVSPPDRSLYPELHGWDNVRGMNLGAIKIINLMAAELNHKVYIVPIGAAVQTMREKIAAGDLESYRHPDDLMSDSIHLSEMGRYIQACLTFCGACRYDVRKLPGDVVGVRDRRRLKFDPRDAKVIHQVVYETVRNEQKVASSRASELPALEMLQIQDAQITKASIPDFERMNSLSKLLLSGDKVNDDLLDTLRAALPNCKIFDPQRSRGYPMPGWNLRYGQVIIHWS